MAAKYEYRSKVNVDVKNISENPCCEHGPSILFERIYNDGKSRQFYACSACRDRKLCPFYMEKDQISKENFGKETLLKRESALLNEHVRQFENYAKYSKCKINHLYFCKNCNLLLKSESKREHLTCNLSEKLSDHELQYPSQIFSPKKDSKFQAQYFFTDQSLKVIMQLIENLEIKKVLCIGVPSVYEYIKNSSPYLNSLLLDIDKRFCNFFSSNEFCIYNLFNHYFFCGIKSKKVYENFLIGSEKILLLIDPPFGGRVELISNTIAIIQDDWKKLNHLSEDEILPTALIFPYFLEKNLKLHMTSFRMLDYQVNYTNHILYSKGPKSMKQGSAVRIFTNLSPHLFSFPSEEGYKFCNECQRSVHSCNIHCYKCGDCTSKDGRTYIHCNLCGICVKPMWIHCKVCNRCLPKGHKCKIDSSKQNQKKKKRKLDTSTPNRKNKKKKSIPQSFSEEKLRDFNILNQLYPNK